jgi:UDP-N-acetylmuramate: L-alanyl-gamma-D-glutamyl-meso-diaminopimelate ligase
LVSWRVTPPAISIPAPDLVVVGNAMKRGLPVVEYLLDRGLLYVSGPEWLKVNLLRERWVLAVAGTHGKTTASSMLAWVLDYAGLNPGFLIGGVPRDFGLSARLGAAPFFVVEADEYDTAFFDKRSKFVHYLPRTLILNNLEFDHADIFDDLAMIQRQFHHLVRIVPGSGLIIHPQGEAALDQVLAMGCWTPREAVGAGGDWSATLLAPDGSRFRVHHQGRDMGRGELESDRPPQCRQRPGRPGRRPPCRGAPGPGAGGPESLPGRQAAHGTARRGPGHPRL